MPPLDDRSQRLSPKDIVLSGGGAGQATLEVAQWPHEVPRTIVVTGFANTLTTMTETRVHHHRKAQLVLTLSGVVTCEIQHSLWVVPPHFAVWIPSGLPHSLKVAGDVRTYCVFVEPEAALSLPAECRTVAASPLLRELLFRAASFPRLYDEDGREGRIVQVLLDQLGAARAEEFDFPMPRDPKLRRVANAMIADPSDRATVAEWGRRVGAAERTVSRILQREVGMSFGRWRQKLHVLLAIQRLAEGVPVQTVAWDLGYDGASSFITMFRKVLGSSPGRYWTARRGND